MAAKTDSSDKLSRFKSGQPPPTVRIIALLKGETPPGLSADVIAEKLDIEGATVQKVLRELSSLGAAKKEGRLFSISDSKPALRAIDDLLRLYDRLAARSPLSRLLKGLLAEGPLEESALMEAARLALIDAKDLAAALDAEIKAWRVGLIRLLYAGGAMRLIGANRRFPKPGTLTLREYEKEKEKLDSAGAEMHEMNFYEGFYPPEALEEGKSLLLAHFPEAAAYLESERRLAPALPSWL